MEGKKEEEDDQGHAITMYLAICTAAEELTCGAVNLCSSQ